MADVHGGGSTLHPPPLPPLPRSPPEMADFGGKRKGMAKVQKLEREIGILQEELKSVGELQPASKSCKEVVDFVGTNADPLMPTSSRKHRTKNRETSSSSFWGWLCGMACFHSRCPCCSCHSECSCHINCPALSTACQLCSRPVCRCSTSLASWCSRECCLPGLPSCEDCSGCGNGCACFSCLKLGGLCCCPCRNSCHNNSHSTPNTSH